MLTGSPSQAGIPSPAWGLLISKYCPACCRWNDGMCDGELTAKDVPMVEGCSHDGQSSRLPHLMREKKRNTRNSIPKSFITSDLHFLRSRYLFVPD